MKNLNLVELNAQELREVEGGDWIKKISLGYLASQVIENWDDIKKGFSEGWAAGK